MENRLAKYGLKKTRGIKLEPAQKVRERKLNNQGKLLLQLTQLHQRIDRMKRDKNRYALVETLQNNPYVYSFIIFQLLDNKKVVINVKPDFSVNCSCMDWRIRSKKLSIPCKHIYYLLNIILDYSLYEYYDNTIQ